MNLRTKLQSGETDMILNTIDELRSLGVGSILELPQIIVCGDQSSGKSSVLNAVSTLNFPTKDGLCTRFATEVIMRPGSPEHIVVSIVPGPDRSVEERRGLETFRPKTVSMDSIENLIDEATSVMGIDPENPRARRFSNDILRFEITGPSQPSLTLVDLPGLFQAPSRYQTEEDTRSVRELVLRYMHNKRSVILAVISAKSDFVLQSVTKYSREVDPRGIRTLGIITKPDKLDEGSDSEKKFVELAENRLAFLHRGWHVLVNRDHNTRDYTQDQRDNAEKQFLSNGVWARLSHNHKGVFSLRSRLSRLLREQNLEELPDLIKEAEEEANRSKDRLSKLGMSRATPEDRRRYLMQTAQTFNVIMRSSINGSYDDKFFEIGTSDIRYKKRLRAVVQNTLMQYSDDMHHFGHARQIVGESSAKEKSTHPQEIKQKDFEDIVVELMKHARGRELMGTYNPMIVRELFLTQSEPWTALSQTYQSKILEAVKASVDLVLQYATDENTGANLKKNLIDPSLRSLLVPLNTMTEKLLRSRHKSHPITYNRSLAESIQKAKQAHAEKIFADKYERAINTHGQVVAKDTLKWLFEQQIVVPPANLARFAASEAIDVMRAYYKIAKETLVDSFSSLAIEDCLVSEIPSLLSPEVVTKLDDDEVGAIAMETETAAWDRSEIESRLEMCESALIKLRKIEGMRPPGPRLVDVQVHPVDATTDINNTLDGSEHRTGTDLSKLDFSLSDQEEKQTSVNDNLSVVEENNRSSQRMRKKRILRDAWFAVDPDVPSPTGL